MSKLLSALGVMAALIVVPMVVAPGSAIAAAGDPTADAKAITAGSDNLWPFHVRDI